MFKKGTVTSFYGQKGGIGKSMLSANIASTLADDMKVLFIDNDRQANSTQMLMRKEYERGHIIDLLDGKPFDIHRVYPEEFEKELYMIPGFSAPPSSKNDLRVRKLVKKLSEKKKNAHKLLADILKSHIKENNFDLVIIDNPNQSDVIMDNIFYFTDYLFMPFKPGLSETNGLSDMFKSIKEMNKKNFKIKLAGIILSIVNQRRNDTREKIQMLYEAVGEKIVLESVMDDCAEYQTAWGKHLPLDVMITAPKNQSLQNMQGLADEILERMGYEFDNTETKTKKQEE